MAYFDIVCYCLTKKKLFVFPVLVALICFGIAWVLPPIYATELRLQVDASNSEAASIGSVSSMFKSSMGSLSQSGLASMIGSQNVMQKMKAASLAAVSRERTRLWRAISFATW